MLVSKESKLPMYDVTTKSSAKVRVLKSETPHSLTTWGDSGKGPAVPMAQPDGVSRYSKVRLCTAESLFASVQKAESVCVFCGVVGRWERAL